jgi:hypothetical protein
MLAEARDVLAVMYMERQLGILREAYIARTLAGDVLPPDFIEKGEQEIRNAMLNRFYNERVRQSLGPEHPQGTDQEDYEARTQEVLEFVIQMTHRRLAALPFVGQPAPGA